MTPPTLAELAARIAMVVLVTAGLAIGLGALWGAP